MPTGSGKNLLFVVPSQLFRAQFTVAIVPLVALKQDLLRRCTQWNVPCAVYDPTRTPHQLHAVLRADCSLLSGVTLLMQAIVLLISF